MAYMRETTTDIEIIRHKPSRFTWGEIQKIHDIGRYTLVEYIDSKGKEITLYHSYVDGKSTQCSHSSLESGIVYAMALGADDNPNTARYMAMAAVKVLGIKGE